MSKSAYELQRDRTVEENNAVLMLLGLQRPKRAKRHYRKRTKRVRNPHTVSKFRPSTIDSTKNMADVSTSDPESLYSCDSSDSSAAEGPPTVPRPADTDVAADQHVDDGEFWAVSIDGNVRFSSHGRAQTKFSNGQFSDPYRPESYNTRAPRVCGMRFAEMVYMQFNAPSFMQMAGITGKTLKVVPKDGNWNNLSSANIMCAPAVRKPNATSFGTGSSNGKPKQRVVSYRDGQRRIHASQCHCARDITAILRQLKAEGKFDGNPECNQGGVRKCVTGKMRCYKGFHIRLCSTSD